MPTLSNTGKSSADERETWTVNDVAKYLVMSARNVHTQALRGEIPGRKIGGIWRFSRDKIKGML